MKIDFSIPIKDLDNQDIKDGETVLTVARICINALLTPDQKDESGSEKVKRFKLAMRINEGGEQNITIDEAAILKGLIGKLYPPLTVGRVYEIFDPESD